MADRVNPMIFVDFPCPDPEAMSTFYNGAVYVNYLGVEGPQRIRDAFGVNHDRLTQVKRKYDPDNFFRLNQNIEPAVAPSFANNAPASGH